MKTLLLNLLLVALGLAQVTVTIKGSQTAEPLKDLIGVNKGPANRRIAYQDAGITSVRTHDYHVSCDYETYSDFWNYDKTNESYSLNTDFDPADARHYSWAATDSQIMDIISNGQRVYFRLGISWPENANYITPPLKPPLDANGTTFANFAALCKHTVMHYNDAWANGLNQTIRYWEIWNEPDGIFWEGTPLQFFQLYKTVADSLKALDSELMVGGPGVAPKTSLQVNTTYLDGFLSYLRDHNGKMDFYSWHSYGIQNPYSLKQIADSIEASLDEYGFSGAESHVTEINDNLDGSLKQFTESAGGAAYYASNIITAQKSPIDRLFWYQGIGFFNPDVAGEAQYTWSGYALKAYAMMLNQAPLQIQSSGDRVVDGHRDADTTNFMVLASRSQDFDRLYILLSNYRSSINSCRLLLKNLPWQQNQSLIVTRYRLQEPDDRFSQQSQSLTGNDELVLELQEINAPCVMLLTLHLNSGTGVKSDQTTQPESPFLLYPNPCRHGKVMLCNQSRKKWKKISVYNILGQRVLQVQTSLDLNAKLPVDLSALKNGVYFINARSIGGITRQKITILQ